MSDDSFNPYHEWLGLGRGVTQPNFYQLLGLDPAEQNSPRIAEAASQAMARVRSCRPGSRGAEWAKVLEEVTAAASCLSDPIRRAEYDRQLGRGGVARSYSRPAPRSRVVPSTGGSSIPTAVPLQGAASAALPMQGPQGVPAAYPQSPAGAAAYLDPMAPVVPAGRPAAGPAYGQASGYGAAAMPPTSPMASYPAAHGHPMPGIPTPTAAPVASGYGYPAKAPRGVVPGGTPAGQAPVGVPLRPASATPASAPGKDRGGSAKARQRNNTSSLTVMAVSAGVGMMILAGAIVLVIFSRKSEDRGRSTYGSFGQSRPIVSGPSSPAETFPRPTPPLRRVRPVERQPQFPVPRIEVPANPTFGPPSGNPPLGPHSGVMPQANSPADNTLRLPAFPAAPTLPSADTGLPPQPDSTAPNESPTMPPQPKESMPDGATAKPPVPELAPGMSDTKPEPAKPTEASPVATTVKPEEVAALAKTLKAAHDAIQDRRYDAAQAELNKVASLPKLPEDHAKYERLTLLAAYAKNFQSALEKAVAGLHPGDEIEVGSSTVVGFVSAAKDSITLRVTGTNRTYALDSLPVGLAVAIADRWMKKDDPASLAMKGAYVAAMKDIDEERKVKAREWLEEASKKGIEGELHKVLDDRYD